MVPPAELLNVFLAWMEGVEEEMAVLNFIYLFIFLLDVHRLCITDIYL